MEMRLPPSDAPTCHRRGRSSSAARGDPRVATRSGGHQLFALGLSVASSAEEQGPLSSHILRGLLVQTYIVSQQPFLIVCR